MSRFLRSSVLNQDPGEGTNVASRVMSRGEVRLLLSSSSMHLCIVLLDAMNTLLINRHFLWDQLPRQSSTTLCPGLLWHPDYSLVTTMAITPKEHIISCPFERQVGLDIDAPGSRLFTPKGSV